MSNLNTSGFNAVEYRIIILPEEVEETTKNGIIIPDKAKEEMQGAKTIATIISCGAKAFDSSTWKDQPKVGDKIVIPTYAGYILNKKQTDDGKEYRIILDRDILAIKREEICQ